MSRDEMLAAMRALDKLPPQHMTPLEAQAALPRIEVSVRSAIEQLRAMGANGMTIPTLEYQLIKATLEAAARMEALAYRDLESGRVG